MVNLIPTLERLRALQLADDGIRSLTAELEELPVKLAALRRDHDVVVEKKKAAEVQLEAIRKQRRDVERDIATADQAVIKFETDKTKVKTNEEFWALNNQIALEKKKKSEHEDKVLHLFDEEESAVQKIKTLGDEATALARAVAERTQETEARAAQDRERLAEWIAERSRLTAGLDEKLLNRYESIRNKKGGIAVVTVVRGGCGGCHTQQPPQKVNEIRKQDMLHICDFCGRFLLWVPEEAPAA